ncbi:cytosolic endo-beta-N-acetylglucosaminidase 1-like [Magnolia sinica]|uniref:cytosolic endo-beta-N-acetylglucosaminidase 1-like n=1 Tax=Magnolia sinica TaxID=86752 RepID=UPI00265ABA8F|nr:cytosolic endo-beta-N-acetylglucosaminidase 1-like [Magnolia sinica]
MQSLFFFLYRFKDPIKVLLKPIQRLLSFLAMDPKPQQDQNPNSSEPSSSPPPFDPSKPSIPISFPITKLQDLQSRSYYDSFHFPFNKASVPLPPGSSSPSRPRMLVCHDMAGGYLDDKWVQGGNNADAYAIWHWYLIDVFVYFSHSLITIPPPCWTNTAHTHGVKILGTFITEWDEGKVIANTVLSTKESAQMYAELLTELAATLGFDGWLINMEVQLNKEQIPNLKEFVNHLTQTMHAHVPDSLVIWYDSVTINGNLRWQNQLNELNKPFFDLCDGIFVNYSWMENYPKLSAAVAGERKFDVYMGIDVFGRGTYGGGQWTMNVALDVLKKDDVSAAIFAPGWVYETKQKPDFQTAQNRWWGLVEKSWGIQQNYPKALPFYSNFDQGHGYHIYVEGLEVAADSWCNISSQAFQPVLGGSFDPSQSTIQVFVNFKDASYNGGGNITFKGSLEDSASFMTRLFQGALPLEDLPIHIIYSVNSDGSSLLGLSLGFSNTNGRASILIAPGGPTFLPMPHAMNKFDKVITPVRITDIEGEDPQPGGWVLQKTSIKLDGYTLTDIDVVCYKKRKPSLHGSSLDNTSTPITTAALDFSASLGHIIIRTSEQNTIFPPATSWAVEGQDISWASGSQGTKTVSVKIIWSLKEGSGDDSMFLKYNIYVEGAAKLAVGDAGRPIGGSKEYLGVARVQAFYVSDLTVSPGFSSIKFIIQVCGIDGAVQKLDDSAALLLDVKG